VSPYRATRDEARAAIGPDRFVEVFVNTPLEECERRDVKRIYAQARRGEISNFTGISDPYEPPLRPEITLSTTDASPEENARRILDYLIGQGLVRPDADADAADLDPAEVEAP
jgi:sulfate adenylyltransferase